MSTLVFGGITPVPRLITVFFNPQSLLVNETPNYQENTIGVFQDSCHAKLF